MKKYLLLLINLTLICFNLFCYNQFFDWNKMTGKMYIEFKPYGDSYYLEKGMYILGTGENHDTIIEHYYITSGKMKELMSLPASETAKFNKFEVIIGRNCNYDYRGVPFLLIMYSKLIKIMYIISLLINLLVICYRYWQITMELII